MTMKELVVWDSFVELNSPYKYQNDSVTKSQIEKLIECFKFIVFMHAEKCVAHF